MKVGEKAKVSPQLTGEPDWVEGEVIDIEQNPFKGIVISIKDRLGIRYAHIRLEEKLRQVIQQCVLRDKDDIEEVRILQHTGAYICL